mmetsp:Transcript_31254/g.81989  ORF Transcript_31254/g.81989 Transcript_31254/m.81989 type:complete len:106 (+) Transcript_31254:416-733(+)
MHAMKTGQLLIQKIEVQQFSDIVKNISNAVGSEANKIEKEKMRAIGLRNKVNSESENRKKRVTELQLQLTEKQAELDRLQAQMDSLVKVESEQALMLDKLKNSEL